MNTDELLQPISASAPCGEDLSFSAEFDQIAEMRREDDPTLDQGEWVTALKVADWPGVQAQAGELLLTRSKDLRLAMWWAEAATLTQGYAGLRQGMALCAELCERYWDTVHPQPEDGDQEQRIGTLRWFLGRLVALSTLAPITRGRSGAYSLQQMAIARSQQATPDKPLPADALTLDKFNRALRETPKDELRASLAALEASQQLLNGWQGLIDTKLGAEGPSFVSAREALASALHELQRLAREAGALSGAPVADAAASTGAARSAATGAAGEGTGGPPRTREQALAQLREVAAFFRATEPHSPVAYLADKAVQWGDMPLHLWLRAVLKDAGALAHVEELLGVEPPKDENA
ncbi:MAG TPA: type VI secretion system protein TssA [Rhizobacter sp.]